MIDYQFNGLPVHVLLVHVVIMIVPLAALCVLLSAFWPAARRRIGIVAPLIALVAVAVVPFTTAAGEWLQARVTPSALIERHTTLGTTLLPWVIALFAIALVQWLWYRFRSALSRTVSMGVTIVITVAAVAVSAGAVITLVQIGESGTAAVWTGSFIP